MNKDVPLAKLISEREENRWKTLIDNAYREDKLTSDDFLFAVQHNDQKASKFLEELMLNRLKGEDSEKAVNLLTVVNQYCEPQELESGVLLSVLAITAETYKETFSKIIGSMSAELLLNALKANAFNYTKFESVRPNASKFGTHNFEKVMHTGSLYDWLLRGFKKATCLCRDCLSEIPYQKTLVIIAKRFSEFYQVADLVIPSALLKPFDELRQRNLLTAEELCMVSQRMACLKP